MAFENKIEFYIDNSIYASRHGAKLVVEWQVSAVNTQAGTSYLNYNIYFDADFPQGEDNNLERLTALAYSWIDIRLKYASNNVYISSSDRKLLVEDYSDSEPIVCELQKTIVAGTAIIYHEDHYEIELDVVASMEAEAVLYEGGSYRTWMIEDATESIMIEAIPKGVNVFIDAAEFNDEEGVSFEYELSGFTDEGDIETLYVGIVDEDNNELTGYEEIPVPTKDEVLEYVRTFDDYDFSKLYAATEMQNEITAKVIMSAYSAEGDEYNTYSDLFTLEIIHAQPVIKNIVLKDINAATVALTGDDTAVVAYCSDMQYSYEAEPQKGAYIELYEAREDAGAYREYQSAVGVFEDTDADRFSFIVTDSRGNITREEVLPKFIDYFIPTIGQKVTIELTEESIVRASIHVGGFFFNDTFGLVNNDIAVEIRYTQANGELGEWVRATDYFLPEITGETYTLDFYLTGFDSKAAYDFQCRVIDKLSTIETPIYTARLTPVFDWSETDFNVNVPTTLQDGLSITGDLKVNDGNVLSAYILSDTESNGEIEFEHDISGYKYIEIYFTDNNGRGCGYTKIHGEFTSDTKTIDLSLIEASNKNGTYIRRTAYYINKYSIRPEEVSAGYAWLVADAVTHSQDSTNYIYITRIVGYK